MKSGLRESTLAAPFDRALELQALRDAAEAYAAKRGKPGSASYRRAWLTFRQRIQSMEDLRQCAPPALAVRGRPFESTRQ